MLLVIIFLTFIFLSIHILRKVFCGSPNNYLELITSFLSSIAIFITLTHILGEIFSNIQISIYATVFLFSIPYLFILKKNFLQKELLSSHNLNKQDAFHFLLSCIFAALYFKFDQNIGQADAIHIAITSILTQNLDYPPLYPPDPSYNFGFYHYGVDLFATNIAMLLKINPWDACSISISLGAFTCFNSIYLIIQKLSRSSFLTTLISSIAFIFLGSINFIEFIFRELPNLNTNFLVNLNLVSMSSVASISYQLRYFSQNFSLGICFLLIFLIMNLDLKKDEGSWLNGAIIFCSSMVVYICYPAQWYPVVTASIIFFFLKQKGFCFRKMICLILPTLLSFSDSLTKINSYKITQFKPSFNWVRFYSPFDIPYFFTESEIQLLMTNLDKSTGSYNLSIPLFSELSFRDFGFILIPSLLFFLYHLIKNKRFHEYDFFFVSGMISSSVPFLIEMPVRQIELYRFLVWGKILCSLYCFLLLINFISKNNKVKNVYYIISFVIFLSGCLTIYPSKTIWKQERFAYIMDNDLKQIILDLSNLHKKGEIAVDNLMMYKASDLVNLAGFYGVGAQIYHTDLLTRNTIFITASPKLLKELGVKYLLIDKFSKLTTKAQTRLNDPRIFKLVQSYNNDRKIFEVLENIKPEFLEQDYSWILTTYQGMQPVPLSDQYKRMITFSTKVEAKAYLERLRATNEEIKTNINYIWLGAQAIPTENN